MIIKIHTIDSGHGAAALNYAMDKRTVVKAIVDGKEIEKVIKPIFVSARNLDVNPLTGEPTSAIDVYHQMRLQEAASTHKMDEPIFRLELRPPVEECRNWTASQWEQFDRDCEKAIQSVTKVPVRNRETGKIEMKAVRPIDLSNAQLLTTRHVDNDPHLHKIINRHMVDGNALSSHYCELVGIVAANQIAEKYGWTRADKRQNQRKERINTDADEVLKSMKKYNIEDFFMGMRMKGWTVDPKYDRNGNAVRYRIGETPKGSDRVVMYGASELGHGRRLMASKLYGTWLQLHPEARQAIQQFNPKSFTPIQQFKSKEQMEEEQMHELYRRLKAEKDKREMKKKEKASQRTEQQSIPTKGVEERKESIRHGLKSIKDMIVSSRSVFHLRDIEDILPEAIAAKAINDGSQQSDWCSTEGLEAAARSLVDMIEMTAEQATMVMEGMLVAIADMVLPPVSQSAGTGGGNNDLPKKKDDDWKWWKNNGFTNKQRRGIQR